MVFTDHCGNNTLHQRLFIYFLITTILGPIYFQTENGKLLRKLKDKKTDAYVPWPKERNQMFVL